MSHDFRTAVLQLSLLLCNKYLTVAKGKEEDEMKETFGVIGPAVSPKLIPQVFETMSKVWETMYPVSPFRNADF